MGSNEVLLQGIIQSAVQTIQNNIGTLADAIAAPIVTAIQHQNVTVDLTALLAATNAVQTAVSTMDADLKSHVDAMSSSIIAQLTPKNSIYPCLTATKFALATLAANTSALLIPANVNRKGFTIYNNSTNSLYVCIENPAVAANLIDFCASNAGPTSLVKWMGPSVPTQAIYVIRNAGAGNVTAWEFT